MSSLAIEPEWIPFSAVKMSEEFLYFTLKLMTGRSFKHFQIKYETSTELSFCLFVCLFVSTDDFQYDRPSFQYFLGDILSLEATVMQYFHVPLRVFVDSCVATLSPDANSNPR